MFFKEELPKNVEREGKEESSHLFLNTCGTYVLFSPRIGISWLRTITTGQGETSGSQHGLCFYVVLSRLSLTPNHNSV